MRFPGAFLAIALAAALAGGSAADTAAARTPSAPALLARATQPRDELDLLGQSSGPFGRQGKAAVSELKFTNRDGYQFTVVAFEQTVALSISKGREDLRGGSVGRFSTTTYLAHGKVTPTAIQASFAGRGRIALRFRPSGKELHASRDAGCSRPNGSVIAQLGLFVGELRFRGEGGYTSTEIHRIHGGSVDLATLLACRPGPTLPGLDGSSAPPPSPGRPARTTAPRLPRADPSSPAVPTHPSRGPKRTTLLANLKLPLSRAVFGAQLRGEGPARFLAAEEANEGRIGIVRLASASGPQSTFTFDDTLADATVAPPTPFTGKGVFQRGIGEKSWTGSLAVSFLGAPTVPLTGSPFQAQLVQSW
jgi:hypothetical protein